MSGFDAAWLALREGADRRARSPRLMARLNDALVERGARTRPLRLVDLGSGTGATVRALAPKLGGAQEWTCVDDVPSLLEACAREARGDVAIRCVVADLRTGPDAQLSAPVDVVTASALLDLVSREWLQRLVQACTARGAWLYCALSYDGRLDWQPPHPDDGAVRAAFNAHQRRDKGFGPALGPRAAWAFEEMLHDAGWRVDRDPSDWLLDARNDAALIDALLEGIVAAAIEQEPSLTLLFDAWRGARRGQQVQQQLGLVIGHRDVFARPPAGDAASPRVDTP